MRDKRILYLALGALLVVGIGAAGAKKAAKKCDCPGENAVQASVPVVAAGDFGFCTSLATLYSVPPGKRLVIEWISAESSIFGGDPLSHPVEVDIFTHDGTDEIYFPLARLVDPIVIGDSFFLGARWVSPVRLYSEGGHPVQVRMCFESWFEDPDPVGRVGFSGFLVDV